MDAREFVSAWNARRRRQLIISVATLVCVATLVVTMATMDANVPAALWRLIVAIAGFVGLITLAAMSVANARCPNCKASKGGAIFQRAHCARCGLP